MHQVDRPARRGLAQGFHAIGFKRQGLRAQRHVVADPHLKQIAEDEDGVGAGPVQVVLPGRMGLGLGRLQMQVRNEFDAAPACGRPQFRPAGQGRVHGQGRCQTATAFSITTSSLGTSS